MQNKSDTNDRWCTNIKNINKGKQLRLANFLFKYIIPEYEINK